MCFMPVTDPKTVKNRVHLDRTSSAADRDQETGRLLALGARRVGIGQTGAESWTVVAGPEETSSASCARRKRSSDEAQHREPQTDPVRGRSGRSSCIAAMHDYAGWPTDRRAKTGMM